MAHQSYRRVHILAYTSDVPQYYKNVFFLFLQKYNLCAYQIFVILRHIRIIGKYTYSPIILMCLKITKMYFSYSSKNIICVCSSNFCNFEARQNYRQVHILTYNSNVPQYISYYKNVFILFLKKCNLCALIRRTSLKCF